MNKKVKYTGDAIKFLKGLVGEVVNVSEFDGLALTTVWFEDIDRKYTVRTSNLVEVK